MTAPVPADPALDAPSLIGAGVQSLVTEAQRLGVSWGLTMATVSNGLNQQVTCDGDNVQIAAVSLIGDLLTGTRVWILKVPPSGNFVIGSIPLKSPGRGLVGDSGLCLAGLVATSTASETAVPFADWTQEPTLVIDTGRIVRMDLQTGVFLSAATASLTVIRLRRGSATTSGTLLWNWFTDVSTIAGPGPGGSGNPQTTFIYGFVKNTATAPVNTAITVSHLRVFGAATINLFGNSSIPLLLTMTDVGAIKDHPDLAAIATTI